MLGVDIGGTFTDLIRADADGTLTVAKVPSSPSDPISPLLSGMAELGVSTDEHIVHGSTVATNAVLQGTGARVALVTTQGFEDVIEIGRQTRSGLYDLHVPPTRTLVSRELRFGVRERVTAEGKVLVSIDQTDLRTVVEAIAQSGAEAVAVSLLFSFLYPEHEETLSRALRTEIEQDIPVSLSSTVLPEFREFERTSTTVLNAYVAPVVSRYVQRLRRDLANDVRIFSSSGGSLTVEETAERPVLTLLSGPAGGVLGAFAIANAAGFDHVITLDMGGTSTDVALCPGEVPRTTEGEIAGFPVRLRTVDIGTVGAGGGSLAHVDAGGALAVGPTSAGADPGPAAYGKADQPTVTDANVVLGRLPANIRLGGRLRLDRDAAERSLIVLGEHMGMDAVTSALGVVSVANSNMERALRRASVEQGYDPREYALVAFGGAGPLHACDLAAALEIGTVIVPRYPGLTSAAGMLVSNAVRDRARTVMVPGEECTTELLNGLFAELITEARREAATVERFADVRYRGQGYELTVPIETDNPRDLIEAFHGAHHQRFGYSSWDGDVMVVAVRVRSIDPSPYAGLLSQAIRRALIPTEPNARRVPLVDASTGPVEGALFERDDLRVGAEIEGPAVVTQVDATTYIPSGWRGTVDPMANLILKPFSRTSA